MIIWLNLKIFVKQGHWIFQSVRPNVLTSSVLSLFTSFLFEACIHNQFSSIFRNKYCTIKPFLISCPYLTTIQSSQISIFMLSIHSSTCIKPLTNCHIKLTLFKASHIGSFSYYPFPLRTHLFYSGTSVTS